MKTKSLKHYLLLFTILLSLIVSFNGCSDDDEPISQTFLEKYDGTNWVNTDELTIYLRLNSNTNKPIEQWVLFGDCYYYNYDFEFEKDGVQYQKIELKPQEGKKWVKLEVIINADKKQFSEISIFDKNGGKIHYKIDTFTPDINITDDDFIFNTEDYPDVEVVDMR